MKKKNYRSNLLPRFYFSQILFLGGSRRKTKAAMSNSRSGFSTLLLILILSLMLELMLFSMMLVTRTSAQRSFSTSYSQESYFAAEGILHDTLLLLRQGEWPPQLPYTQKVHVGDVVVDRLVTYDKAKNTYHVAIESEFKEAKRKLVAQFTPDTKSEQNAKYLDIIFVLDTSESMKSTIAYLKNAVTGLIDAGHFSSDDRIAVINFSKQATIATGFTSDTQHVKDVVRSLTLESDTNLSGALQSANSLLQTTGRPDALQVIVIFTDGVPTYTVTAQNKNYYCSETCFDPHFGNTYLPENGGSYCTDAAIDVAEAFHSTSVVSVYGVFFARNSGGSCQNIEKSQKLGRLTLQQVVGDRSHYFETQQLSELKGLFQSIGKNITETKLQYSYKEVAPE